MTEITWIDGRKFRDVNEMTQALGPDGTRARLDAMKLRERELAKGDGRTFGRLKLRSPGEAAGTAPRDYVWKGVLAAGEFSVVYGKPGCGKSFFAVDLGYAIAQGREAFERRVRKGAVLYCGLEGGTGIGKRVRALYETHGDAPGFSYIAQGLPLFGDPEAADDLIEAAKSVSARLIIVDTLARAMPGGNENDAADMGRMIAIFDRIREATGAHVLVVHHAGKDATLGSRGHSSLKGAADVEIEVARREDGTRVATVTKSKDDADGARFCFGLDVHSLGVDDDGDEVTTCLVRPIAGELVDALAKPATRRRAKTQAEMDADLVWQAAEAIATNVRKRG